MPRFYTYGSVCIAFLMRACGGGGGGDVASTPAPSPAPAPAPSSNSTLANLVASQQFVNDAVTSEVSIGDRNLTTASSQSSSALTISYDAAARSYLVTTRGRSETFLPSDQRPASNPGQIDYEKSQGDVRQYLTLTDPRSAVNGNLQYVGGGYWQRNDTSSGQLRISFDAFAYGLASAASAIPRTGTASYKVNLFGFFAPLDRTPKAVVGSGTFTADMRSGAFYSDGGAREIDLTDPYYTGEHSWRAAGLISANSNSFTGGFAYNGRERFSVTGKLDGRFYGPQAQELGAAFHAEDGNGTLLTGTLLGQTFQASSPVTLNVLDSDRARTFYSSQEAVLFSRETGAFEVTPSASILPDTNGRIEFSANGAVQLIEKPSSLDASSRPTFGSADYVPSESNSRYNTYRLSQNGNDYKLVMYKPGPDNEELALTYTSFGRWDRVLRNTVRTETANVWFAYGVPTPTGTLARTGTAGYTLAVHGSGVKYADGSQYSVSGGATMSVDFGSMAFGGSLNARGKGDVGGVEENLGSFTFGGKMSETYAFQSSLVGTSPDFGGGEIKGRLYGPQGNEIGATFYVYNRDAVGLTGQFAGAAVGIKD